MTIAKTSFRFTIVCLALIAAGIATGPVARAADPDKVFRYAFEIAETSFDPQRVSDVYSNIVNSGMFDTPLKYDYLARPLKLKPNTLDSMPEVSQDGLTYTLRLKPGIYFADDPAFKGKKRELTAEDYVYSIKRLFDPKLSSPLLSEVEGNIVGSDELLAKARKANKLDYDAPLEGLKTLDRYTLRIKLTQPFYTFIYNLADCRVSCAVAREVVEHYGDDVGAHPVGTGPYHLAFWKRSSKMVFEANPNFRELYFDAEPAADDANGQEILARLKGKRLPMVGRIEVSVIEETQPRLLAFLNGEHDFLFLLPEEFANLVVPNNRLAPNLQKLGLLMRQEPALDLTYAYFNMKDPVVGGYTPDKVALRRAITLAYNTRDEISIIRKNQAIPAQTPYSPGVAGYDPAFRTGANEYNPAKAKALLDMFGYIDRDGDGYRDMPDGSPLVVHYASPPTSRDQQFDELWKRSMDDIGIKFDIKKAKWPDLLKEAYQGKLMMWQLGNSASKPDAEDAFTDLYGPNAAPKPNLASFQLPEFDRLFEKARVMPDSPERTKVYQEMTKIIIAYAPWKFNVHRIRTDLWYPWVIGYRRPLVLSNNFWQYIDIDPGRPQVAGK
jgi:ABC-type transport system substrate-binding protein